MFGKLLKHDMRSVWRKWWILLIIVPSLSLAITLILRFFNSLGHSTDGSDMLFPTIDPNAIDMIDSLIIVALSLVLFFCVLGLIVSTVYTTILVFWRFYKNLYTDEGYLTFTLPVKRTAIHLSKTVNALFWHVAHAVLLLFCLSMIALFAPAAEPGKFFINPTVFREMGELISIIWKEIGAWFILYAVELLLLAVLQVTFTVVLIQFCITFAAMLVKKAKLLLGIGIYYVVNATISFVLRCCVGFGGGILVTGFVELAGKALTTEAEACGAIALILLLVCVVSALLTSVAYCATQNCMDRKINLA